MKEKIYAFLDTARKTAVDMRKAASGLGYLAEKEGKKAAASVKLNARILAKKREIQAAYQDLGKALYDKHIGNDSESDALMDKLNALDALHLEIAEMEKESGRVSVIRTCPTCGAERRQGDAYCRDCGEKFKTDEA